MLGWARPDPNTQHPALSGLFERYRRIVGGQARLNDWQGQDQGKVVVRGDPVMALEATAQAAVDEDVLALWPGESADRSHEPAAITRAIAGGPPVDVARVEADRAMVAMSTAARRRADQGTAVSAAKLFAAGGPAPLTRPVTIGLRQRRALTFKLIRVTGCEWEARTVVEADHAGRLAAERNIQNLRCPLMGKAEPTKKGHRRRSRWPKLTVLYAPPTAASNFGQQKATGSATPVAEGCPRDDCRARTYLKRAVTSDEGAAAGRPTRSALAERDILSALSL